MANYYVLGDDNCRYEGLTKEQILAAIEQAVNEGKIQDIDTGFITIIKENNKGRELSFWVGTRAEYNALTKKVDNCLYIITDDEINDISKALDDLIKKAETIENNTQDVTDKVSWLDKVVDVNLLRIDETIADVKKDNKLRQEELYELIDYHIETRGIVDQLNTDMTKAKSDMTKAKSDITTAKSDITNLKSDVKEIKNPKTIYNLDDNYAVKNEIKFTGANAQKMYDLIMSHKMFLITIELTNGSSYTMSGYRENSNFRFSRNRISADTQRYMSVEMTMKLAIAGDVASSVCTIALNSELSNSILYSGGSTTIMEVRGIRSLVAVI